MNRIYALALATLMLLAAGCSLPGMTPEPDGKLASGEKDLCEILTAADVGTVLGFTVVAEKDNLPQNKFTSGCRYVDAETAATVSVLANFDDSAEATRQHYLDAVKFIQESPDLEAEDRVLPDVGTENHAWSTGKATQINTVDGTVWISLTLMTDKQNDYETAAALARLALQKLRD